MDLQQMAALGISVRHPWVDHPYSDRGRYVDQYSSANQYTNISGWGSQVAPGGLPASHLGGRLPAYEYGGAPPRRQLMKFKKKKRRKYRSAEDILRDSARRETPEYVPERNRLRIVGKQKSLSAIYGKNPSLHHVSKRSHTRSPAPARKPTTITHRTRSRTPLGDRLPEYEAREAAKRDAMVKRMREDQSKMKQAADQRAAAAMKETGDFARAEDQRRKIYTDVRRKLYLERQLGDPNSAQAKMLEKQLARGIRLGHIQSRPEDKYVPPSQKKSTRDLSPTRKPTRERSRSPGIVKRIEAAKDAGHQVAMPPPQLSNAEIRKKRVQNLKITKPAARRKEKAKFNFTTTWEKPRERSPGRRAPSPRRDRSEGDRMRAERLKNIQLSKTRPGLTQKEKRRLNLSKALDRDASPGRDKSPRRDRSPDRKRVENARRAAIGKKKKFAKRLDLRDGSKLFSFTDGRQIRVKLNENQMPIPKQKSEKKWRQTQMKILILALHLIGTNQSPLQLQNQPLQLQNHPLQLPQRCQSRKRKSNQLSRLWPQ